MNKQNICLIEDDPIMGESLVERLEHEGYAVTLYSIGAEALSYIPNQRFDLIISDIRLPDMSGEQLYRQLIEKMPAVPPVIFITGYGTIDQAINLLRLGAADYLTKPLDMQRFLQTIATVCRKPNLELGIKPRLGISRSMREIESSIARLARYPEATVLIQGESGVGKEVSALLLHELQCPSEPFEAINCAAFPHDLAASELFGHKKGSFTGAIEAHTGAFERSGSGILFLDEIGDTPLELQIQLLRSLQERTYLPVGAEKHLKLQARIVCATNQDLRSLVQTQKFREDLYYRINAIELYIPPLRKRPEDIVWLAEQFLLDACQRHGESIRVFNEDAKSALFEHAWPGNVRELKHHIERICILSDSVIITADTLGLKPDNDETPNDIDLRYGREQEDRRRITAALIDSKGRINEAAQALGISRKSLWQKRKKYGL